MIREYDCLTVWDASHAAGSVNLDFAKNNIDLAVGCTYKYLVLDQVLQHIYMLKKFAKKLQVPIQGWFAQKDQFEMGPKFIKSEDIRVFK